MPVGGSRGLNAWFRAETVNWEPYDERPLSLPTNRSPDACQHQLWVGKGRLKAQQTRLLIRTIP